MYIKYHIFPSVYSNQSNCAYNTLLMYLFTDLRNQADLEVWVEELSAVHDKKTIHQLYRIATDAPHRFVYKLDGNDKTKVFYLNFSKHLVPGD